MENTIYSLSPFSFSGDESTQIISDAVGDFMGSDELEKGMRKAMDQIRQWDITSGRDYLPEPTHYLGDALTIEVTPQGVDRLMQKGIEAARAVFTGPEKDSHSATVSHGQRPPVPEDNPKGAMPLKKILFEACTINQPLNASLRDRCSTGRFYFLK